MSDSCFAYLITDPQYYSQDPKNFERALRTALSTHHPEYALYRDKENSEYEQLAAVFVSVCQEYGIKAMLHNNAPLAQRLHAFGVHYSSDRLCSIGLGDAGLYRVLSCHSFEELEFAQKQGLDAATYSPIFSTPGKGEPVGLDSLKEISATISLPIIALGGITTKSHIDAVTHNGASGFASIRYFIS